MGASEQLHFERERTRHSSAPEIPSREAVGKNGYLAPNSLDVVTASEANSPFSRFVLV